jgi:lysozyme family protein
MLQEAYEPFDALDAGVLSVLQVYKDAMMKDNFPTALAAVLVHEGGYVNDSRDPGGATNKGITQATYDDWREVNRSVKLIEAAEVAAIYRARYWNAVKGDSLPSGVDYAVFDFAVNSGVARAARFLQMVVGAAQDGAIGPATLALVNGMDANRLIDAICDRRLAFLRSLSTFDHFGRGWTSRVEGVRAKAKAL